MSAYKCFVAPGNFIHLDRYYWDNSKTHECRDLRAAVHSSASILPSAVVPAFTFFLRTNLQSRIPGLFIVLQLTFSKT